MRFLFFILFTFYHVRASAWGFYAHQKINRLAVFTLPSEMIGFYKHNIVFITEQAVAPDRRRYAVEAEAPRHYIDLDVYGDSAAYKLPRYWKTAIEKYTEDTLQAYGIVPWYVFEMKQRLTTAFRNKDAKSILRLSADIGHYIADAHVPLHTTRNYNGQLTGQQGIHSFWESRLPELFDKEYDFLVGRSHYLKNPQTTIWQAVTASHLALDSVLLFDKKLTARFPEDKKYTFEERNGLSIRTYSRSYSEAYHRMLNGQVERRMQAAIKMTGDFWYTCWIDGGQPDLQALIKDSYSGKEIKEMEEEFRKHEKNGGYKGRAEHGFLWMPGTEMPKLAGTCCGY